MVNLSAQHDVFSCGIDWQAGTQKDVVRIGFAAQDHDKTV
jgi:hypothetical protein